MKVLVITYYWPPSGGSGVQRWLKTSKYLPQYGWEPVIYTPLNPDVNSVDESLLKDVSPDLEVIKRKIVEPYGFYKVLTGKKKGELLQANLITGGGESVSGGRSVSAKGTGKKKSGSLAERISRYIRANWFIPDPRIWWVRPSVKFLSKYIRQSNAPIAEQNESSSEKRNCNEGALEKRNRNEGALEKRNCNEDAWEKNAGGCCQEKIAAIISTGPPHSMHLIARQLHRDLNIPWIADFRDPWTNIFYFKHLGLSAKSLRKHKALERSVLEEADKIVVVSKQMKKEFVHSFSCKEASERGLKEEGSLDGGGYLDGKIVVIPNGYDPDDFDAEKNTELAAAEKDVARMTSSWNDVVEKRITGKVADGEDDGKKMDGMAEDGRKFVVAHTGLMPESANPDKFWKVLGDMVKSDRELKEKLLVVTMGQTDGIVKKDIAENGLSDNFKDLGYVPHAQSVAWQKRADILLLLLRKEEESKAILTGKFFEYLAAGKPILAFGPTDGDLADILKKTSAGTICEFADEDSVRKAFTNLWAGRGKITETTPEAEEERQKFSRKKQAGDFAEMLNRIASGTIKKA